MLERWRGEWRAKGESAFPGIGRRGDGLPALDDARRIAELERKIGQLTMENDFLKKALQHFRDHHPPAVVSGADACLKKSSKAAAKGQAVNALCQMTGLSRAGFYRWRAAAPSHAGRDGTARSDAEGRTGIAGVWLPKNHL